jgi:hypothetical protein
MSASINVLAAHHDKSDSPQYFIYLKNGRWRPVDALPGTLAVMYRGLWRAVFCAESDEEYFAARPDAKFRLAVRPSRVYRDFFTFKITTRNPEVYATGDSGDIRHYRPDQGSPRANMIAECERMLADSNRCRNSERWLASQVTHQ